MFKFVFKPIAGILAAIFSITSIVPDPAYAQLSVTPPVVLPAPGTQVDVSSAYSPTLIKGLTVDPQDPFHFEFIIDSGDVDHSQRTTHDESLKLIKYFLASLALPEKEMWVNLSPVEKDRIIPDQFGKTEMGRDLLGQDYILKQLTATLMSPENEEGKKFWEKVYERLYATVETQDFASLQNNGHVLENVIQTFNKVWIVPETGYFYEHDNTVFIVDARLKVMLEEDYLAASQSHKVTMSQEITRDPLDQKAGVQRATNDIKSIIRSTIIPIIENEVNTGENFANLRQIYNAMLLGVWFKKRLKSHMLSRQYVNQEKIDGIDLVDAGTTESIWNQYVASLHAGASDLIKEEYDPVAQQVIPRNYFTGGAVAPGEDDAMLLTDDMPLMKAVSGLSDPHRVSVSLDPAMMSDPEAFKKWQEQNDPNRRLSREWTIAVLALLFAAVLGIGVPMVNMMLRQDEIADQHSVIAAAPELRRILKSADYQVPMDALIRDISDKEFLKRKFNLPDQVKRDVLIDLMVKDFLSHYAYGVDIFRFDLLIEGTIPAAMFREIDPQRGPVMLEALIQSGDLRRISDEEVQLTRRRQLTDKDMIALFGEKDGKKVWRILAQSNAAFFSYWRNQFVLYKKNGYIFLQPAGDSAMMADKKNKNNPNLKDDGKITEGFTLVPPTFNTTPLSYTFDAGLQMFVMVERHPKTDEPVGDATYFSLGHEADDQYGKDAAMMAGQGQWGDVYLYSADTSEAYHVHAIFDKTKNLTLITVNVFDNLDPEQDTDVFNGIPLETHKLWMMDDQSMSIRLNPWAFWTRVAKVAIPKLKDLALSYKMQKAFDDLWDRMDQALFGIWGIRQGHLNLDSSEGVLNGAFLGLREDRQIALGAQDANDLLNQRKDLLWLLAERGYGPYLSFLNEEERIFIGRLWFGGDAEDSDQRARELEQSYEEEKRFLTELKQEDRRYLDNYLQVLSPQSLVVFDQEQHKTSVRFIWQKTEYQFEVDGDLRWMILNQLNEAKVEVLYQIKTLLGLSWEGYERLLRDSLTEFVRSESYWAAFDSDWAKDIQAVIRSVPDHELRNAYVYPDIFEKALQSFLKSHDAPLKGWDFRRNHDSVKMKIAQTLEADADFKALWISKSSRDQKRILEEMARSPYIVTTKNYVDYVRWKWGALGQKPVMNQYDAMMKEFFKTIAPSREQLLLHCERYFREFFYYGEGSWGQYIQELPDDALAQMIYLEGRSKNDVFNANIGRIFVLERQVEFQSFLINVLIRQAVKESFQVDMADGFNRAMMARDRGGEDSSVSLKIRTHHKPSDKKKKKTTRRTKVVLDLGPNGKRTFSIIIWHQISRKILKNPDAIRQRKPKNTGGVDLNIDHADIRIQEDINGFKIPVMDPAMMNQPLDRLIPVILDIRPMTLHEVGLKLGLNIPAEDSDSEFSREQAKEPEAISVL